MDVMTSILLILFILVLFLSLFFTLIGFPGNWFMMIVIALMGLITKGEILSFWQCFALVGALLLGEVIEFILPVLGLTKYKPSRWTYIGSTFGAIVGAMLGTAMIPLVGSFLGAAIGVFIVTYCLEIWFRQDDFLSRSIAKRAMVASLIGMSLKFAIAVTVLVYIMFHVFVYSMGFNW